LDDVYDPYYKTKNYLNVIPKNELDWHKNIAKYYKFDENVSPYGTWVTVNERARLPAAYVYATRKKQAIKK
jgi:hypothetical protein